MNRKKWHHEIHFFSSGFLCPLQPTCSSSPSLRYLEGCASVQCLLPVLCDALHRNLHTHILTPSRCGTTGTSLFPEPLVPSVSPRSLTANTYLLCVVYITDYSQIAIIYYQHHHQWWYWPQVRNIDNATDLTQATTPSRSFDQYLHHGQFTMIKSHSIDNICAIADH